MTGALTLAVAAGVATAVALPPAQKSGKSPAAADSVSSDCPAAVPAPGPGVVDPFHVPLPAAAQQNADGKVLYRQGRWEEAREKYRAAEMTDPEFLAPALNVACSFVRQERYADAMTEVLRLLDRAYLPWSQEVLTAADLGALKVRPEGKRLRAALDQLRARWAEGLSEDVVFVARSRAPLKVVAADQVSLAAGPRALVLGLRQEVFAWSPRTLRYRQLTSEEGRVLAVARSPDQRRIAYVTAEKLIRDGDGGSAFRGVAITELELDTLTPIGRGALASDVVRLAIRSLGNRFAYQVGTTPAATDGTTFVLTDGILTARAPVRSDPSRRGSSSVIVTGAGVSGGSSASSFGSRCRGDARDVPADGGAAPSIAITFAGARSQTTTQTTKRRPPTKLRIGGPHGAGLGGLPVLR